MEVVYLETSFISLLVGNPSRDLIIAGNQLATGGPAPGLEIAESLHAGATDGRFI